MNDDEICELVLAYWRAHPEKTEPLLYGLLDIALTWMPAEDLVRWERHLERLNADDFPIVNKPNWERIWPHTVLMECESCGWRLELTLKEFCEESGWEPDDDRLDSGVLFCICPECRAKEEEVSD